MAIVAGSKVMLKTLAGIGLLGSAPLQGIVVTFATPACTVAWSTGGPFSASTIDLAYLDEITAASADNQALVGKRMRVAGQNPALDINVLSAYKRDATDMVMGITDGGAYRELAASSVVAVP